MNKRGGKREGAGRPKGSKSVNVNPAVRRQRLGIRLPAVMIERIKMEAAALGLNPGRVIELGMVEYFQSKE